MPVNIKTEGEHLTTTPKVHFSKQHSIPDLDSAICTTHIKQKVNLLKINLAV